jgi:hypothetical protein
MSIPGKVYHLQRPAYSPETIEKVGKEDPQLALAMKSVERIQCSVDIVESKCTGCRFWQHDGYPCDCACTALAAAQAELSIKEQKDRLDMSPTTLEFYQRHFHK